MKLRFLPVLGCFALVMLFSCKTTNHGFISRNFHNLTAHYNGYYNACLKIDDGAQKLADSQTDLYDRTLPVFKYADAQKAKSIYPQMDEAIKKTSTVIQRHTLVDKNGNEKPDKEHWIDDNWVAYGKALFYKHEYFEAIEAFKYVETTYKNEQGRHEASMWLVKTYLQLTQLKEAEDKLDYLRNQKDLNKKVRAEYDAIAADYYLQVKNTDKAIEHLTRAVPVTRKRNDRIRYMFILAQLYQQKGDFKKAFDLYTQVIKKNPVYEMAFNARINRARCFDAQSQNSGKVKAELQKMAKDPKNKEYLDQVYYALAGISQKEGKEPEEIVYLEKSIAASTSNQNQKAFSYLELGKIYLGRPDYRLAQAYYDSCIGSLSNDYPDYTDILTKRNALTKLIKALNVIENEDSLQALAKLSPADREKAVNEVLRKEEEERQRKLEEEKEQQVNQLFSSGNTRPSNQSGGGSSWYFYNAQAMNFGTNDFVRKWNGRKLEDNWRRSNKEVTVQEEETVTEEAEKKEELDPKEALEARKKEMLDRIPSSDEEIQKSTAKVVDAYYNAAMIYRESLNDPQASVKMFEELLSKYPDNKYKLQAFYQLYRTYATLNNTQKSEYYKNILLEKYPDSDYAMIIKDPNYLANKMAKKTDLELFYEDTYRKYLNGEYADVITRKAQADAMYPGNVYVSKFDMLKTLAIGRTQPISNFTASLQDIVRNYSEDPVKEQAQNILDYINGMSGTVEENKLPEKDTVARLYTYLPDTAHMLVIAFRNIGEIKADQLKIKLSNYNNAYYSLKDYQITDQLYDHQTRIVLVQPFLNKDDALQYFNGVNDNDEVFGNTNPYLYQIFVVSVNNFPAFVNEKKIEPYLDFFRRFYR